MYQLERPIAYIEAIKTIKYIEKMTLCLMLHPNRISKSNECVNTCALILVLIWAFVALKSILLVFTQIIVIHYVRLSHNNELQCTKTIKKMIEYE